MAAKETTYPMTQLQNIIDQIKKLESKPITDAWKAAAEKGEYVKLIGELRDIVRENRVFASEVMGLHVVEAIEEFNPFKRAELELSALMDLYKPEKEKRDWPAIKVKVGEINMLFEMANVKI